jgi:hypothetical protein
VHGTDVLHTGPKVEQHELNMSGLCIAITKSDGFLMVAQSCLRLEVTHRKALLCIDKV